MRHQGEQKQLLEKGAGEEEVMTPFVHIVESPSSGDLLHGYAEGRALSEAMHAAGIPSRYCIAADYQSLCQCLTVKLDEAWRHYQQPPILHLSMHGDSQKRGLAFTDGTIVEWPTLGMWLAQLNSRVGGALLVSLSACFGTAGMAMSMNDDAARPFSTLVGNHESVDLTDLIVGFAAFYHLLLFKRRTLDEAVAAMRVASGNDQFAAVGDRFVQEIWRRVSSSGLGSPPPPVAPPTTPWRPANRP